MKPETTNLGGNVIGDSVHSGLVKVRLAHREQGSLLVPDQVYLSKPAVWFQPNTFMPCLVANLGHEIQARLYIDVDGSHTLNVAFKSTDLIQRLPDGTYLYRAKITGVTNLSEFASGSWKMVDSRPYLHLYHHTTETAKDNITAICTFWASKWNLRGTGKLKNVNYVYFTSLPAIKTPTDLASIAMSPEKVLHYVRDGADLPSYIHKNWQATSLSDDILKLEVLWSSPEQREHTVALDVDCALIAPHHVWCHKDFSVWYEIVLPRVFRVGVEPGVNLEFSNDFRVTLQTGLRQFEYMVIGDATTLSGLAAPMDEEQTKDIFKLHDPGGCLLRFWCDKPNRDYYTGLEIEKQQHGEQND